MLFDWRQWLRRILQRRSFERECEAVAFLEGGNVFGAFLAGVADFQQIGFEDGDAVGQKFGERAVQIVAERGVQRVLENVRELAGDFREARETVAAGGSGESVRGDVQALEVFAARRDFLQYADVLAQVSQMLRGFLEED